MLLVLSTSNLVIMHVNVPFSWLAGSHHPPLPVGMIDQGGGGEQENYHVTLISNEVARGGPLIQVKVNGVMLDCFIDTGSEITLFKDTKKEGKFKICGAIFSSYEWGIWTIFQIY